jgi:pimeloyl-ACP methyl ester carboxylesterase
VRVDVGPGVGLEVDTWDGGDAVPFLLVHGLASNRRTWEGVAARLHELAHPVATVDLRGHGRSDKPDDGYDFQTMGGDLVSVLDAVGFTTAVVAGQSTGGNLVVDLARREPDRVAGVAGIDGGALELVRQWPDWERCKEALTPPALAGSPAAALEAMLRRGHPSWSEWGVEVSMANFEHLPDGTIRPWLTLGRHLRILRALWEHRPSTVIPRLDVDVLLVMADTDDAWAMQKQTMAAELTATSRRVRVEWISPGDHDLHIQYPIEVADLLHTSFPEGPKS